MFVSIKNEIRTNLLESTVVWTMFYISSGLNMTSDTGGHQQDDSNSDWIVPVVIVIVAVVIFFVVVGLMKYRSGKKCTRSRGHNDDEYDDVGTSMLDISRDTHIQNVNMFEDSFLGIKTRINRQDVDHSEPILGNSLHTDPYLASHSTVKNKRVIQDDNIQCSVMKGDPPHGQERQERHAEQSIEHSSEDKDGFHVPVYHMQSKSPRGLAVIIGIDDFNHQSNLKAVVLDREMVKKTFKAIEFKVVVCKKNNKQDIEQLLLDISKKSTIDYDCFVCYISSHGFEGHICCKDDDGKTSTGLLKIGSVIGLFTNDICKTFAGKPKVFYFDICLGAKEETRRGSLPKGPEKMFENEQEKNAAYAHIYVGYATIPGYVSWADDDGSRFTKALTCIIDKAQSNTGMDDIWYGIYHKMTHHTNPQTPTFANKLVKKLVLKKDLRMPAKKKSLSCGLFE